MSKNILKRKILELERDIWDQEHYKKQQEFIKSKQHRLIGMNNKEKKLWAQIRRFIKEELETLGYDDPASGRLKLSWFDKLNVEYDVLFIRAKKNTGKTYQLGKMVENFLKYDINSQFIYIRNTTGELDAITDQLAVDDNWPIFKKGNALYVKKRVKGKYKMCGKCISITGESAKTIQGASNRKDLRAVIYDEANFTNSKYGLRSEDLTKIPILFSSLARDKKDLKIYMFGNTLRNEDGTTSDIFLDGLGVLPGVALKILKLPTPDGKDYTTILYVDFGSELKGAETQKFLNIFGNVDDLLTNNPQAGSKKIIGINYFLHAKPLFAYLFSIKNVEKVLYVGELIDIDNNETHLITHIEMYDHNKTYKYQPFTDELVLFTKYFPRMKRPEHEQIEQTFIWFTFYFANNKVWFTNEESAIELAFFMKMWNRKFKLDYLKSDWA